MSAAGLEKDLELSTSEEEEPKMTTRKRSRVTPAKRAAPALSRGRSRKSEPKKASVTEEPDEGNNGEEPKDNGEEEKAEEEAPEGSKKETKEKTSRGARSEKKGQEAEKGEEGGEDAEKKAVKKEQEKQKEDGTERKKEEAERTKEKEDKQGERVRGKETDKEKKGEKERGGNEKEKKRERESEKTKEKEKETEKKGKEQETEKKEIDKEEKKTGERKDEPQPPPGGASPKTEAGPAGKEVAGSGDEEPAGKASGETPQNSSRVHSAKKPSEGEPKRKVSTLYGDTATSAVRLALRNALSAGRACGTCRKTLGPEEKCPCETKTLLVQPKVLTSFAVLEGLRNGLSKVVPEEVMEEKMGGWADAILEPCSKDIIKMECPKCRKTRGSKMAAERGCQEPGCVKSDAVSAAVVKLAEVTHTVITSEVAKMDLDKTEPAPYTPGLVKRKLEGCDEAPARKSTNPRPVLAPTTSQMKGTFMQRKDGPAPRSFRPYVKPKAQNKREESESDSSESESESERSGSESDSDSDSEGGSPNRHAFDMDETRTLSIDYPKNTQQLTDFVSDIVKRILKEENARRLAELPPVFTAPSHAPPKSPPQPAEPKKATMGLATVMVDRNVPETPLTEGPQETPREKFQSMMGALKEELQKYPISELDRSFAHVYSLTDASLGVYQRSVCALLKRACEGSMAETLRGFDKAVREDVYRAASIMYVATALCPDDTFEPFTPEVLTLRGYWASPHGQWSTTMYYHSPPLIYVQEKKKNKLAARSPVNIYECTGPFSILTSNMPHEQCLVKHGALAAGVHPSHHMIIAPVVVVGHLGCVSYSEFKAAVKRVMRLVGEPETCFPVLGQHFNNEKCTYVVGKSPNAKLPCMHFEIRGRENSEIPVKFNCGEGFMLYRNKSSRLPSTLKNAELIKEWVENGARMSLNKDTISASNFSAFVKNAAENKNYQYMRSSVVVGGVTKRLISDGSIKMAQMATWMFGRTGTLTNEDKCGRISAHLLFDPPIYDPGMTVVFLIAGKWDPAMAQKLVQGDSALSLNPKKLTASQLQSFATLQAYGRLPPNLFLYDCLVISGDLAPFFDNYLKKRAPINPMQSYNRVIAELGVSSPLMVYARTVGEGVFQGKDREFMLFLRESQDTMRAIGMRGPDEGIVAMAAPLPPPPAPSAKRDHSFLTPAQPGTSAEFQPPTPKRFAASFGGGNKTPVHRMTPLPQPSPINVHAGYMFSDMSTLLSAHYVPPVANMTPGSEIASSTSYLTNMMGQGPSFVPPEQTFCMIDNMPPCID